MSNEELSKELEEFTQFDDFKGKLKVEFMGMSVKFKFVGKPAINNAQTIGRIGMEPEQGLQTVIFYSKDEDGLEIITTSGDPGGEVTTDKQSIVMLNASATPVEIYQKHKEIVQGKALEILEKFEKKAKKIPKNMMKTFTKQMQELGDVMGEMKDMDKLIDAVGEAFKDPEEGDQN